MHWKHWKYWKQVFKRPFRKTSSLLFWSLWWVFSQKTRAKHIGFLLSLDVGNYKLVTNEYIEPTVKICLMDWSDNK